MFWKVREKKKDSFYSTFKRRLLQYSCLFILCRRHNDTENIFWCYNQLAELETMLPYPLPSILTSVKSGQVLCSCQCFSTFHYSLHTKYMLLEVCTLFQEFICVCGVEPFQGDGCHPSITKPTFWLLNRTMGTHRRQRPCLKSIIQNEEAMQESQFK